MSTNPLKPLLLSRRERSLLGLFFLLLCLILLEHFYLPILDEYRVCRDLYQKALTAAESGLDQEQAAEPLNSEIKQLREALSRSELWTDTAFSGAAFLQFFSDQAEESGVVIRLIELSDPAASDSGQAKPEIAFHLEIVGSYGQTMRFLRRWYAYDRLIISDSWSISQSETGAEKEPLLQFESEGKILLDQGGLADADTEAFFSELSKPNPFAQR
ncbi:MAG: hypothetical protein LLG09_05000 [Negativicutes bacterium]|nr:hypothetical protein [Negativicutes bacterium]